MLIKKLLIALILLNATQGVWAEKGKAAEASTQPEVEDKAAVALIKTQNEALYIGEMVQELQVAIRSPNDPNSLKTISFYGTDSRYYPMVRGWLFQELIGVESLLYASKTAAASAKFQHHSNFLKKAIRLVDLE